MNIALEHFMKTLAITALLALCFLCSCHQVERDGARSLENANSVVGSAGQKVWTNDSNPELQKKRAQDNPGAK